MSELLRQEFLERIQKAVELDDWERVEHWSKQWLQASARDPEAFRWLGRASHSRHKLERAAYAFSRLLDYIPGDSEARNFFNEYPSSASRDVSEVKQSQEDSPGSNALSLRQRRELAAGEEQLGGLYLKNNLYAIAAERFERSFDWNPSEESALNCARAYHAAKESHKAVRFLRDQILESQNWVGGRVLLGKILYELGQLSTAQKEWQSALKIDPENKEALDFLRHCLTR